MGHGSKTSGVAGVIFFWLALVTCALCTFPRLLKLGGLGGGKKQQVVRR